MDWGVTRPGCGGMGAQSDIGDGLNLKSEVLGVTFLFSVSGKCLASEPGKDSPFLETCSGDVQQKWQLGGSIAWKSEGQ